MTAVECHVYWTRPSADWSAAGAWLTPGERSRHDAYRPAADRARFVAAAGLLRRVVGERLGLAPGAVPVDRTCPDCGRPHGRPTVPGAALSVSVSHSGDRVAVAVVTGGPPGAVPAVGVDVERVDERLRVDELARLVLSTSERAGPPLDRYGFYRVWTRKEALLKATGDGLRTAMSAVVLTPLTYPGRPGLRATVVDLAAGDGYAAAVAVLTDAPVGWRETTVTAP